MRADQALVFHLPWYQLPSEDHGKMMAALADWGIEELTAPQYFHHEDCGERGGFPGVMGRLAVRHGMRFTAAHGLLGPDFDLGFAGPEALARHGRFLRELAPLGVRTYVLHPGTNQRMFPGCGRRRFWERVRSNLERLLPTAAGLGVTLALENIYEGADDLRRLVELVESFAHPNLGLCVDVGHAQVGAAGLPAVLGLMRNQAVTCHLHDNHGSTDEHEPAGSGTLPWAEVMAWLDRCPRLIHGETESRRYSRRIWEDYQALWRGKGR